MHEVWRSLSVVNIASDIHLLWLHGALELIVINLSRLPFPDEKLLTTNQSFYQSFSLLPTPLISITYQWYLKQWTFNIIAVDYMRSAL